MNVTPTSLYPDNTYPLNRGTSRQAFPSTQSIPAIIADRITVSKAAQALSGSAADTADFDTSQGRMNLNIDAYFVPDTNTYSRNNLPPLLLPSPNNIKALAKHISSAMPQFLKQNNIPSAPSTITYDTEGKMQLPADYPYAAEFKQALDKNPAMERELRTVNALSSHYAEMLKAAPFQKEYAAASSTAEQAAVVQKYSWLFSQNRHYSDIALHFSTNGTLSMTADDQPLQA